MDTWTYKGHSNPATIQDWAPEQGLVIPIHEDKENCKCTETASYRVEWQRKFQGTYPKAPDLDSPDNRSSGPLPSLPLEVSTDCMALPPCRRGWWGHGVQGLLEWATFWIPWTYPITTKWCYFVVKITRQTTIHWTFHALYHIQVQVTLKNKMYSWKKKY